MSPQRNNEVKRNEGGKRRGGTVTGVAIGALLVFLMGGGVGMGLSGQGEFFDNIGSNAEQIVSPDRATESTPSESAPSESETPSESTEKDAFDLAAEEITVTVSGNKILLNGEAVEMDRLSIFAAEWLQRHENGKILLKDDKAIKATYEDVKAALSALNAAISEQ